MKKFSHSTADKVVQQLEKTTNPQKTPLKAKTSAKITAFVLTLVMLVVLSASVLGAYLMLGMNLYTTPKEQLQSDIYTSNAKAISSYTLGSILDGQASDAVSYCSYRNVTGVFIDVKGEDAFQWHYGITNKSGSDFVSNLILYIDENNNIYTYDEDGTYTPVVITVYLPYNLTESDTLYMENMILNVAYALRYWVYVIGLIAFTIGIYCFAFLMSSAGHRQGTAEIQPGWGTWVPADLLAVGYFLSCFLCAQFAVETGYQASAFVNLLALFLAGFAIIVMTIGLCMSIAVRLKLGSWWKNTILYYVLRIAWRILRKLGKMLSRFAHIMVKIPLVWKTAAAFVGLSVVEFFVIMITWWEMDIYTIFWIFGKIVLFPIVMYIALMLKKLQKAGKAIASGDLSYQVDTKYMLPDFKAHGENLNQIGEGMTLAVENRLKSERMKTELITNVSHDIKTPLTSIINYSDLIEKEPSDNPQITEYASVLHRQSERLKRLIEDLVEASKASTGNLEVLLAPCEVGVMMTQAIGEYEQRLEKSQLKLVTSQPEDPVRIMADGRRLWRVFDNLMNNICKYGQPGTRVYFSLETAANEVVIAFKNTSREPLNLSPDELLERFVRGDSARNSDGNGLGLSIAKSLTELQNGSMELTVDGDLFKVILRFPRIQ